MKNSNKNVLKYIFTVIGFLICLIPSAGMIFSHYDGPIGNEREVSSPKIVQDDKKVNTRYLSQLGTYFEKHIAFRPYLITADSLVQNKLFMSSGVDSVIAGKNNWLFYKSTLDNYTGRNLLSDDQIQGIVGNLELIKGYCDSENVDFLFTVSPNKNTLYPDNIPYYCSGIVSDERDADRLQDALMNTDVSYCDLFSLFENEDRVLYLERDSHWTNEGAALAFDSMLSVLGKDHVDFSLTESKRVKDFYGDLSKMVYPSKLYPEFNTYYDTDERYKYINDVTSVEDTYIQTQSESSGSLYMYRDSFGNALIPFFASSYGNACFSKSLPSDLKEQFSENRSDTYILEIVERNISHLITDPPLLPFEETESVNADENIIDGSVTSLQAKQAEYSSNYLEIRGTIRKDILSDGGTVFVSFENGDEKLTFPTYYISTDDEDCREFLVYLSRDDYSFGEGDSLEISVTVSNDGTYTKIYKSNILIGGI